MGAVAAIIVFYTGTLAADSVNASAAAEDVMKEHMGWAWWTIWFYGIYAIARIVATWWTSERHRLKFHVAFFLLSFIGMYFLYETGDHGSKMVFGYGLGTGALKKGQTTKKMESKPGFHKEGDQMLRWTAGKNATQVLADHFSFLQGDTTSMNAMVASTGDAHMLNLQNPDVFFVTNDNSYSSMQLVVGIHPGSYKGDIILAHHVQNASNYGYLALHPDGSAELGRVENGESSSIEEGSFDWQGMERLKLSVGDDHIKGYVNGEQILHGHAEQAGPGSVGLKLDGNGTFRLRNLKVTTIAGGEHEQDEGRPRGKR